MQDIFDVELFQSAKYTLENAQHGSLQRLKNGKIGRNLWLLYLTKKLFLL